MAKNQYWRELQLATVRGVMDAIEGAHYVKTYPSRKHAGITMFKIQKREAEYTGQLRTEEIAQLSEVLKPFTMTQTKDITIYTRPRTVETRLYLEYAITAVDVDDWHPANDGSRSTWKNALDLYNDHQPITANAIEQAGEIIDIMTKPEPTEYGYKLASILKQPQTEITALPFLASAVVAIKRRKAREAAAQQSRHIGTIEQVYTAEYLEVAFRRWVDTRRGPVMLYKLRDHENNQFTVWHDSETPLPERFTGDVLIVAHQEYQGVKETVIRVNPLLIRQLLYCPACNGSYEKNECTCILEPSEYRFEPGALDVEIDVLE